MLNHPWIFWGTALNRFPASLEHPWLKPESGTCVGALKEQGSSSFPLGFWFLCFPCISISPTKQAQATGCCTLNNILHIQLKTNETHFQQFTHCSGMFRSHLLHPWIYAPSTFFLRSAFGSLGACFSADITSTDHLKLQVKFRFQTCSLYLFAWWGTCNPRLTFASFKHKINSFFWLIFGYR